MTSMNSSLGSLLLLSLLSGGSIGSSRPVASPSPSAGSNPLLLALLLGGGLGSGGASAGLGLDFSSLFGSLSSLFGGGSSGSGLPVYPDIATLIPSPTTPTTPTTPTPAPTPTIATLPIKNGTLPFDPANPPAQVMYDGRLYKFNKASKTKGGDITALSFKSPTKLKMGLNYLTLTLKKGSSSSSSSGSLSGSWTYTARTGSPLVFDLNGDGQTKTLENTQKFDIDNDGQLDTISQIDSRDGLLVMDADKDGVSGKDAREVFGNHTLGQKFDNGFDALKAVAKATLGDAAVADGRLDTNEIKALENKLKLGLKVGGNVKTLSELGISSVNLNYDDNFETVDDNNNIIAGQSAFTQNGQEKAIHDIFFRLQ